MKAARVVLSPLPEREIVLRSTSERDYVALLVAACMAGLASDRERIEAATILDAERCRSVLRIGGVE